MLDASAVASAWTVRASWREAAPSAPRCGMSRVFAYPGTGALARTATRTGSGIAWSIAVGDGQIAWVRAREIGEAQPPHGQDGAKNAVPFPAPARRYGPHRDAGGPRLALEAGRECDVLHEGEVGVAAHVCKGLTRDEDRLVARRDAGKSRTGVHQGGDNGQQRMPALDRHVEAA